MLGRDPTAERLERHLASMFGKEEGMFVMTGTMGNLVSCLAHCPERGSEFIVGDRAHIYIYEQGGSAALGGLHPRVVKNQADGTLDINEVVASIRPHGDDHFPITKLVCIENTQNKCGGKVLPVEYTDAIAEACASNGLKLHLDGARVMNAVAALQVDPARLCRGCDSISICLSKALGAPMGSVVLGDRAFIQRARRVRKVVGGATRQCGVMCAMALYGVQTHGPKLRNDHENAAIFAKGISEIPGIEIDTAGVQSNLVFFSTGGVDACWIVEQLQTKGVLMLGQGKHRIRACTHHQVSRDGVLAAVAALEEVMATARAPAA